MEWRQDSSKKCSGFQGCFKYSLAQLQRQDTDIGLKFFVIMYVYNIAGHFTTLKTSTFTIPSKYPPGNAVVQDVDPADMELNATKFTTANKDVDAHFSFDTVCASWTGFKHQEYISVDFGIGTLNQTDNIHAFQSVNNTGLHCLTSHLIPQNTKLFISLRATSSGGTTISRSDGVIIYDPVLAWNKLQILDGLECFSNEHLISKLYIKTTNNTSEFAKFNKSLNVGKMYTLRLTGNKQIASSSRIESLDVIVHHIDVKINHVDSVFQSLTSFPQFKVVSFSPFLLHELQLYDCQDRISAQKDSHTITAHWIGLAPPFNYDSAVVILRCPNISNGTCVEHVTPFQRSHVTSRRVSGLNLKPFVKYHVIVRPCLNKMCLKPKYSAGIYVEHDNKSLNILSAEISVDKRIGIVIQCSDNYSNIVFYQWSISTPATHRNGTYSVVPWKTVFASEENACSVQVRYLLISPYVLYIDKIL